MVIVDTSVLIDFLAERLNPETAWLRGLGEPRRVGITSLIQTETLQGIRDEARFLGTLALLNQFEVFETGSSLLAVASATNYRALRRAGVTIRNTIDCLIATFCLEEGHTLLHNDRDFDPFEAHLGLKVLHPPELLPY
jgi:predicted nucleic acid-binding protein